jgi:hypothetical protein
MRQRISVGRVSKGVLTQFWLIVKASKTSRRMSGCDDIGWVEAGEGP